MKRLTILVAVVAITGCVALRPANYREPTADELRVPHTKSEAALAALPPGCTVESNCDLRLTRPSCDGLAPPACSALSTEWARQISQARDAGDGWTVGCSQDRVTRDHTCFAQKHYGAGFGLRVQYFPKIGYCFSGALNNHPGRRAVIRFDSNPPIYYEETLVCGDQARAILSQLAVAKGGAARGSVWPNKTEEFAFDTVGFERAHRILQSRVANLPES